MSKFDMNLFQVVLLGLAFMFVYAAVQTTSVIQTTVMESIRQEDPTFSADGYLVLAIAMTSYGFFNAFAPAIVAVLTPKWTLAFGTLPQVLLVALFLHPITEVLYAAAVFGGLGDASIWTAQGNFMTLISDAETIDRNWNIFWALYQTSYIVGNLVVYLKFEGVTRIEESVRQSLFTALVIIGLVGLLIICVGLRSPVDHWSSYEKPRSKQGRSDGRVERDRAEVTANQHELEDPASSTGRPHLELTVQTTGHWARFKLAMSQLVRLFLTPDMMLLSVTCFYTGIHFSFFGGVLNGAIGFTTAFGDDRAKYVGLSGMLIGVGEVTAGLVMAIVGRPLVARFGRKAVVGLAAFADVVGFILVFMNLPDSSVFGTTSDPAFIDSKVWMPLLASFLFGASDVCYQTQLGSIMGIMYPEDSALCFGIYQVSQGIAAGGAFFYSSYVGLYTHLTMLAAFCIAGTVTFSIVAKRQGV